MELEPLELVKQIGEHKWRYAEELLIENPNINNITVQSSDNWEHILLKKNENFTRLTIFKKNNKNKKYYTSHT